MKRFVLLLGVVMLSLFSLLGTVAPVRAVNPEEQSGYEVEDNVVEAPKKEDLEENKETSGEATGGCNGGTFLWMRPWYYDLACDASGGIAQSNFAKDQIEETIRSIIMVVIYDITVIVGIMAAGFLIYGGYQYIYSTGDGQKAARGKKTIAAAIIGMIISLLGNVIVNTIGRVLGVQGGATVENYNLYDINPEEMIGTVVNFVLALAVLVAVGFIIYSGIIMMTAYGDANKTANAKKGIGYSVAGLLVALLAFAIVNFVLGGLSTAMPNGNDTDLFVIINNVFGIILGIGGLISVIGVIVGGIYYITSAGEAARLQKGKTTVMYSLIGLIVVLVAGGTISFVIKSIFA